MPIESVMPSHHLILCCPLLLLPLIFPSIGVFSNESALLQHQHQSFQWIFRVDFLWDWLGWSLCCPRHSQKSSLTPQFESINSLALSTVYCLTLTSVHDYWKNHSLAIQTFVGKLMSLLFNMLSRFIIAFLPRGKCLLKSFMVQSPSTVILEPKKIKVCHCFYCFPIYLPWSDGTWCLDLSCLNVEF